MVRGLTPAQWVSQPDRDQLASALCDTVAANLQETIDNRGEASLVVSGGSTPLPFFKALSQVDLDWSSVSVLLADERWVPFEHKDSNARFVAEHLLVNRAAAAKYISLYEDVAEPESVLESLETRVGSLSKPLSVVILGMGEDGHTASLFPQTRGLDEALALDNSRNVVIMRPASQPQIRVSLTRQALLNSRYRYLHITGEAKKSVLENALNSDLDNRSGETPGVDLASGSDASSDGSSERNIERKNDQPLPIAAFFEKHVPPIAVYWSA